MRVAVVGKVRADGVMTGEDARPGDRRQVVDLAQAWAAAQAIVLSRARVAGAMADGKIEAGARDTNSARFPKCGASPL